MAMQLNASTAQALAEGVGGQAIELPFLVPPVWVTNGDPRLASLANTASAVYYGGWVIEMTQANALMDEWNQSALPAGFTQTILNAGGKQLDVAVGRSVFVALIGMRKSWYNTAGARQPDYEHGFRQHVQALCFMGNRTDRNSPVLPFGPIMLSAKGHQATNLSKAFSAWERHTKPLRDQVAPGVPAWAFYLSIGTYGDKIKQVTVGKGSQQSQITPITPYLPEGITEATLESLFVGQELADTMVELKKRADEWLHAWDAKQDAHSQAPDNWGGENVPDAPYPMNEDDIPF